MGRVLELIGDGRIVAILRGGFDGRETEIVELLADTGITAVEVTLNSPDALGMIAALAARFG
ncbi:MAG: 2-dehydro-3-deoxyphosphogluconate aldolase, partial [Acidobacteria bacterium]|nr:2-dehydro-3-deoxyphosphogluconate aldolase [Acidobacteriota bacterium]